MIDRPVNAANIDRRFGRRLPTAIGTPLASMRKESAWLQPEPKVPVSCPLTRSALPMTDSHTWFTRGTSIPRLVISLQALLADRRIAGPAHAEPATLVPSKPRAAPPETSAKGMVTWLLPPPQR